MYDIIPDIHGQSEKLKTTLKALGYRKRNGAWRHVDPARTCLFLGDFIDRGPNNAETLTIVRAMIDAGSAQAVMGNHELNAVHFHTLDPKSGKPLRCRSEKNQRQHGSFLAEFPIGATRTAEAISWMQTLPLFLELPDFRAVHACWDEHKIAELTGLSQNGVLSLEQFIAAADVCNPLNALVETTTKGPETELPDGYYIVDKDGHRRSEIRVKWWQSGGHSWADIAMSVPEPAKLPTSALPEDVVAMTYPAAAKPVFFGHYWLVGAPVLQAPNALCLDYSAGRDGPLMSYGMQGGEPISLENITAHGAD